jgi:CHASE3 domain sensor protein
MTRGPRWLRARIGLVVLIGALLVGGGVGLLLANTLTLRGSADASIRTDTYLLRVVDVEGLVIDAETGLRGDVITGRSLFLQPLRQAQARMPAAERNLRQSAAVAGIGARQVDELLGSVDAYMTRYVPGVQALVAQNPAAARSLSVTLEGKREVDAVRRGAGELEQTLSQRSARRQRHARATANTSVDESIIVLFLLTLLTCALGGYLGHLVVARERAREQSEETARTLQESILPPKMPPIPGCELAVRFVPGEGPISGDFYDSFIVAPDTWALVIGDVCGKGAPAAAATAMARWTLRSSLGQGASPADALRVLNDVILGNREDSRFITAVCLIVKLQPDVAVVEVACAGHPAPILVRVDQAPTAIDARGDLLGVFTEIRLETAELRLHRGDSLVSYTDGITDQGPELRLAPERALRAHVGADADGLASALEGLARPPVGRHPDDVAVIALRFLGQRAERHVPAALASRSSS